MARSAADIRAQLKHPVIDGDGHWVEPIPVFLEYLRDAAGAGAVDDLRALWRRNDEWYRASWQERQHKRLRRTIWWGVTTNTRDKATALELAGPYLAEKYQTYAKWGQDEVLPGDDTFRQPFEDLLRDRFVIGSPEECYEQLRPSWEQAGANFLIFRTHWSGMPVGHALASMRLISDELLPALRRVTPAPC